MEIVRRFYVISSKNKQKGSSTETKRERVRGNHTHSQHGDSVKRRRLRDLQDSL